MTRLARFCFLAFATTMIVAGCSGGGASTSPSSSAEEPSDPVVASYADTSISLSTFESAYRKANGKSSSPSDDSLAAYREFLDQYLNYRLKVRAAREAGLDTLPSVRSEVAAYRQELARPRIMRSSVYEPVIRQMYERRQTEVEVSHILIRVKQNASPEDTLDAYQTIQAIADSARRGVPFAELAYRNSEDPSAQKEGQRGYRGRLGYLRAGQIVSPFEDRMYNVSTDSVSEVFRTRFGYHILKVHDRRPAKPPIRLSHIMLRPQKAITIPLDGSDATTQKRPQALLDSLRTALVRDSADFAALAREYSDDRRSASRGGDLGKIQSIESLPPGLRDPVAALDSVGAISDVVQSQYGYHLLKLTARDSLPSFEEAYEDLKEQISGKPRVERRKAQYAQSVRAEVGVTVDTTQILRATNLPRLDTLSRPLLSLVDSAAAPSPPIATIGDSTFTLDQLARHVMQTDGGARMTVGEVLDDFLDTKTFQYAGARLEEQDPSFAAKMKEYREGLLAFQFMQDSVWTAAAQDSSGLRAYFENRRDRYRFPDRVRTLVLRAPDDSLLHSYSDSVETPIAFGALADSAAADSLVSVDTTMVTDESPDVYQTVLSMTDSSRTGPIDHDGRALLLARDRQLPARQKTFAEARSSVVRDYQDQYEDEVLRRLRQRYDADTHPDRLRAAFRNQ